MRKIKRRFTIPAFVLAVTLFILRFVLFIGYVPTESMEPTLHKGSFIFGSRIFYKMEVGDIVVFRHEGRFLVKRVAGVGGDIVECRAKKLSVPTGELYLLGDNEGSSWDSRYWEYPFISEEGVCAILMTS